MFCVLLPSRGNPYLGSCLFRRFCYLQFHCYIKLVKELNVFPAFSWMFDKMEKADSYNQRLSGSIDYIALPVQ